MTCYCGESAEAVCRECEQPFCDDHLWGLWEFVCDGCLDTMGAAS